jgi:hypothetical protein
MGEAQWINHSNPIAIDRKTHNGCEIQYTLWTEWNDDAIEVRQTAEEESTYLNENDAGLNHDTLIIRFLTARILSDRIPTLRRLE